MQVPNHLETSWDDMIVTDLTVLFQYNQTKELAQW